MDFRGTFGDSFDLTKEGLFVNHKGTSRFQVLHYSYVTHTIGLF